MKPEVPSAPVRVLMVDDSQLIRVGLRAVLEDRSDIVFVGEAANASEAIAGLLLHQPDVVLLDLRLPDRMGHEVCREIMRRRPGTHVLILTSATDEKQVHEAVSAGAQGYLLKDSDGATLADAILRVASGQSVLDPTLSNQVVNLMRNPRSASAEQKLGLLTSHERRMLGMLTEGLTNKEIGLRLNLTEKTVKNYLSVVFEKLGITRRAQAAALFVQGSSPDRQ